MTPEPVLLDFAGINVATASFLREAVLDYLDAIRRRHSNFYPVVANENQVVEEELKVLVSSDADVLMLCLLDENDQPHEPRLLGRLDPKQRLTFDLVQKRHETDAAELMREHRETLNLETSPVQKTWRTGLNFTFQNKVQINKPLLCSESWPKIRTNLNWLKA